MIFPDEKMIEAQVRSHALVDAPPEFLSAYYDGFKLGAQWAIAHIKSAASEDFEAWQDGDSLTPMELRLFKVMSEDQRISFVSERAYQVAVISTAAKYEEKLREKDAEIATTKYIHAEIVRDRDAVLDERSALQAENEQLKSEIERLKSSLSVFSASETLNAHHYLQVENEQLKAAVRDFAHALSYCLANLTGCECDQSVGFACGNCCADRDFRKHADLITKINKGE